MFVDISSAQSNEKCGQSESIRDKNNGTHSAVFVPLNKKQSCSDIQNYYTTIRQHCTSLIFTEIRRTLLDQVILGRVS